MHSFYSRFLLYPRGFDRPNWRLALSLGGGSRSRSFLVTQVGGAAALLLLLTLGGARFSKAQGNSGTISGTVVDQTEAGVSGAAVKISNPVSAYTRSTTTDDSGRFVFSNVPFNPYHLSVAKASFQDIDQDVQVESAVPLDLKFSLKIATAATTVTVQGEAADLIEQTPITHTDIDRALFDKLPLESQSSSLSSLITLASPGVVADSNGLFHGLGDHAENSFSVDGQPITDQQSKVFSNQIPVDSIQSMEVIAGAPPAEYGGKTSVVAKVTTRSGLGETQPHGDVTASYGTFGTANGGFDLGYGGNTWGNFISANGLNTSRFLDPPEFNVMHDKGNEENIFDRVGFQALRRGHYSVELGIHAFLVPNSQYVGPATSNLHGSIYGLQRRPVCTGLSRAQPAHRHSFGADRSALANQDL